MGDISISPAPITDNMFTKLNILTPSWISWFTDVYERFAFTVPLVSTNNDNLDVTLTIGVHALTQQYNTPITATRTVTFSTKNLFNGAKFRIVRRAGCTGAFNINIGSPTIKSLTAAGQWADMEYTDSEWICTASGTL